MYAKAQIIGRLTRDPETKTTGSGSTVCNFSVATNYYKGQDKDQGVNYLDCEAWGKIADTISKYLSKGKKIFLECEIRQNRWEDDQGRNRSKIVFVVTSMKFLENKQEDYYPERGPVTAEDVEKARAPQAEVGPDDDESGIPF